MFNLLSRYICKIILGATSVAALIIFNILFIMSLLGEAKSVGQGDYGFIQSVIFVILRMPNEIYHFSPIVILLGSIIGLSILSSNRELAVMRASGFSIRNIILSVLSASFILILLISFLGENLAPGLSYKAVVRKENAQNGEEAVVTASGIWFHIDNNFIHIQNVVDRHLLKGVTRYQFDNAHHLKEAYYAKTLIYHDHQWQMQNAVKTIFYDERTKSQSFETIPWDLRLNTNLLKAGLIEPSEMSLYRLSEFSHYLEKNGLQSTGYKFNFWQRIFQPFASVIMIFLAIPFVLGTFRTSTMSLRIIMGILVGFCFSILNALLGELCIVYQIPAFIAAIIPPFLFAIFGVILTRQMVRY